MCVLAKHYCKIEHKMKVSKSYSDSDTDSDYVVEEYVKPKKIRKAINDDSADILGNFDDVKRLEIEQNANYFPIEEYNQIKQDSDCTSNSENSAEESEDKEPNTNLSKDQLDLLLRGTSKANRYVIYVTNLKFETTKQELENHLLPAGEIKSIRIPKKRRGGFAFVEMNTIEGFQKVFSLHNTLLNGRNIKIQISEGGKKKSANKKNVLKQKNRKLAEMRNEPKAFSKSGKNYDKSIKKEKEKESVLRTRWRKTAKKA